MADQDRAAAHALIEALRQEPYRFDFFHALRLIESVYADKPRLGTSLKAADDPVRLAQDADLEFAPSTLASLASGGDGRPVRLAVHFLGLFGPNGPLPLHLTEHVRARTRHHNDRTFARFADIFHHRMLSLFYRAWASAQPTVSHDRPASDRFAAYIGSLCGVGAPSLQHRDAMPDAAKLHYVGLLACQTRHADGLRAMIEDFFQIATEIQEFVGEWMDIAVSDQTRLGISLSTAALGRSTVVGERVWGCQHKFRIVLGPLGFGRYRALLPGGGDLIALIAVVRNYMGDELAWDLNLVLRHDEVPALRLDGAGQLGWTTWLGPRKGTAPANDLRLNPLSARRPRRSPDGSGMPELQ
jgi:type VI secretion system protein ImpH